MTASLATEPERGSWRRLDNGWELRFERRLRHSPERVWRLLTTPEGLAGWLAEAVIEPREGGRMDLHFTHPPSEQFCDPDMFRQSNRVVTWSPFDLFEHTFDGTTLVRWELRPDGDGTHLTLIHRLPASEQQLHQTLSGWHHHMEGFEDAVVGRRHPWSWDRWTALDRAYADAIREMA